MGRLTVNGGTVWHAQHQGPGTGMNADKLDGSHLADVITGNTAVDPVMSYAPGGQLSGVSYADGTSKEITYKPSGQLDYIDVLTPGEPTVRKTFVYDGSGALLNITQSIV